MVKARSLGLSGKITLLVAICCLVMVVLCVNTAVALDGTGTQEDPWLIQSLEDFNDFAADANYWAGYTRLETDVNLAGITYSTAVIAPDMGNAFTGVFDGNDHKVLNLSIDDGGAGNKYVGLFGCIGKYGVGGHVRNLGLEGGSVIGKDYVGGLVGYNYYSTISNCYATVTVTGSAQVGGLVGKNGWDCTVSNCYSTGNMSGVSYVGGLVGTNYGYATMVLNCYATGTISGCERVGGLVGRNEGTVANCNATSNVSGDWYVVGGLVGFNGEYSSVSNCYATGIVSGGGTVGGLVGWNWSGTILKCYATGGVTGDYEVGGLVGDNHATVSNCNATGNVNGNNRVGGLVGEVSAGIIEHCSATGNVFGDEYVGGLVGTNSSLGPTILNCYATGTVSGYEYVGGLLGSYTYCTVLNCYATSNVSGYEYVGGLVGFNNSTTVSNCYSTGDVNGINYVGGLVGEDGSYLNYYYTSCFWDIDINPDLNGIGNKTDPNVVGSPTTKMQTRSTFTDADWDFINIWNIGENQTYPYLRVFLAGDINKDGIVNFLDLSITANQWMQEQ